MSGTLVKDIQGNDCGCCDGIEASTPLELFNRPGLSVIAYRMGAYHDYLDSMQASLSNGTEHAALKGLRSREASDFSIALLDAWAVVADVLSFYQERFANESYLRTATERLSLLEQARLIGYELSPGVAAGTWLAFTLDDAPGAPEQAAAALTLEPGIKVQSTPGPEEDPQTYEIVETIEARVEWNTIKPRLKQPQALASDMSSVVFEGTKTSLKQGDLLLLKLSDGSLALQQVIKLSADETSDTTQVDFTTSPSPSPAEYNLGCDINAVDNMDVLLLTLETELSASLANIMAGCWNVEDIVALAKMQAWDLDTVVKNINTLLTSNEDTSGQGAFAFRRQAAVFGYNAQRKVAYKTTDPTVPKSPDQWDEWDPAGESDNKVFLDNAYSEILDDSYIVIHKSGSDAAAYQVDTVSIHPHTAYGISGKTTELTLDSDWWEPNTGSDKFSYVRSTSILAQSEALSIAAVPINDDVAGNTITLDKAYLYLRAGQHAILTGERSDLEGISSSEVVQLKQVLLDHGFTVLVFEQDLNHSYKRSSVTLNANVAQATHGESVHELLGNGDATQAHQQFVLKQVPLTYVSTASGNGSLSTLEVRVDNIRWDEVSTLYGRGPHEQVYTTRMDDDGKVTVQFGDGINGTRLPSGQNNVRASYRKGVGLAGLVKARQLNQLLTRPLGLKEAINPLAPSGAADPEHLAEARANAPLTVLTLGRTVSLQDYEDYSRAFAGIAKAKATEVWDGHKKRILITVAGPNNAIVAVDSDLYVNLAKALLDAGDPLMDFRVLPHRQASFRIAGTLIADPAYEHTDVLEAAETRLRETFAFDQRDFGQPVMLSEVIAVLQQVDGVIAVDIDKLYRAELGESLQTRLDANWPESGSSSSEMLGAELLLLDAAPLTRLGVKS